MYMNVFPVIMTLCNYLSVCLCVFTLQKIEQARGPEHFLTLLGLRLYVSVQS